MSELLTTPYEEAKELLASGAQAETIVARMQARGLDGEEIGLLLNAIGARPVALPPRASTVEAPMAAPSLISLGPPPTTVCTRCGAFLEQAWVPVLGKAYCTACGARPEVNYPRAYRDAHWGKRDSWAWFMGVTGLLGLMTGAQALTKGSALGVAFMVSGICSLSFWSGARAGRAALVIGTLISVLITFTQTRLPNVIAIYFVVAALRSPRTKLFFEMDVSEAELAAAWLGEHDNQLATVSRALGFIALATMLTWLGPREFAYGTAAIGAVAVFTGVIGLSRVNPNVHPPIGRKGAAIVGVVTGAIAVLAGGLYLALPHF